MLFLLLVWLQPHTAFFENGGEVGYGLGTKHGYAGLAEVGDALEYRTGCQVPARVEYAPVLVDALYVDAKLLLQDIDFVI